MAKYKTSSNGLDLLFEGPDTVEAYDTAAGKLGSCLADACSAEIWRGTLPEWQREFSKVLVSLTGVERATDEKKTAAAKARAKNPDEVSPVKELFSQHLARAKAKYFSDDDGNPLTGDTLKAKESELQAKAQEVADSISIDPSPSRREAGASKAARDKADSLLLLDDDTLEQKVAVIEAVIGSGKIERDEETGRPTKDSLAKAVDAWLAAGL
jgi:hypothetical protein